MAFQYSTEHGYEAPVHKAQRRAKLNEWVGYLPKLYTVNIADDSEQFISDRESIRDTIEDLCGGHCVFEVPQLDGTIKYTWRDSIDDELIVLAVPCSVHIFNREIQEGV